MSTVAELIAQHMIADGFVEGTVGEARDLAGACDRVLTRRGMALEIVCIVDRESDRGRRFNLEFGRLEEIGVACSRYSSTVNGLQLPCNIRVIEAGPGAGSVEDRERLKRLVPPKTLRPQWAFSGWSVDTERQTVSTTMAFNGLFGGRRQLERIVRHREAPEKAPAIAVSRGIPWATVALLAVLAAVFAIEIAAGPWSGVLAPQLGTLIALGGESRFLVIEQREWHRVLTAALLHADLFHLALNGIALFMAGALVERLVGWGWMLTLFAAGALGGSALSLAINPPEMVSVGASSAIMALFAGGLILVSRLPGGAARQQTQVALLRVLIPSLLPLATTRTEGRIDFAGHFGGAIAGAVVGAILLMAWSRARTSPAPLLGRALAGAGILAVSLAVGRGATMYPAYAHLGELVPAAEFDAYGKDPDPVSARLLASFPHDPRSHALRGQFLASKGKFPEAEQELRAALGQPVALRTFFKPELQRSIEKMLALVLAAQDRRDEARLVARSVCGTDLAKGLAKEGLCE